MKKLFSLFFISIFLFSCQKEKQVTITGLWKEISVYSKDNSGVFYWSGPPKFPLRLTLSEEGKYSAFNDVPAGHGSYQYNYSTRQLRFENSSGSIDVLTVSALNDNYLIIEYSSNGVVEYKQKFLRN
jgi:hypothetical protein